MGLVIERVEWEPGSRTFFLLFCSCFSSIFLFPYLSKKSTVVVATNARASPSSLLEFGSTTPFLSFQRSFLFIYSLASGQLLSHLMKLCLLDLLASASCRGFFFWIIHRSGLTSSFCIHFLDDHFWLFYGLPVCGRVTFYLLLLLLFISPLGGG